MPADPEEIGIGPTEDLCLRVSAAALVRVLFPHPDTREPFLALEQKVSLSQEGDQKRFRVIAQPFGGSIRLNEPAELLAHIHNFHFDSLRSKAEKDFRILIRPADWEVVKQLCLAAFRTRQSTFLETNPVRELAEEFFDAVQVPLSRSQYWLKPVELLVENEPVPSENVRAAQTRTARIYTLFEARLIDNRLIRHLFTRAQDISDQKLMEQASEDARNGGKGRANGVLALPIDLLNNIYRNLAPENRNERITAEGHEFEGNVPAVLQEVFVPKYERFSLYG